MLKEAPVAELRVTAEVLSEDIRLWYEHYAEATWNSINAMVYPNGLPADRLHYLRTVDGTPTETTQMVDHTSPTNIGFKLACDCAGEALGKLTHQEAQQRAETTLDTVQKMMADPKIFVPTNDEGKGLFVNWLKPSDGTVLTHWSHPDCPPKPDEPEPLVIQQLSAVENMWFLAYSRILEAQFPELSQKINAITKRIDLPFMLDRGTGFFRGVYLLDPPGFSNWSYNTNSEMRAGYAVCGDEVAEYMPKLMERRSERSTFVDSTGRRGRTSWQGEGFATFWVGLILPEDELNPQWADTYRATIQAQRDYGKTHNGGHYGYSAGLDPGGRYYEFRVPETGENEVEYTLETVVTVSALVNMGIVEPVETCQALQQLHHEFPCLTHTQNGDGDTVNTATGEYQPDQLFPNQAATYLACWNILRDRQPRKQFMLKAPAVLTDVYRRCLLW